MNRTFFHRFCHLSLRNFCLLSTLILLPFTVKVSVDLLRELSAFRRETAYFEELERLDSLDRACRRLPETVTCPPTPNDRLRPLFPDLVQLNSWSWAESLRLHPDGSAQYPMEHVWIYIAGNKTCPKDDGLALCESFVHAFDRVIQYHHVARPAAGAFLSFVDCDISPGICDAWGVDANIMVNLQTMSPCDPHLPTEEDPEFRFHCVAAWRFIGLPLKMLPNRSLRTFPSAYEQLLSLTTNDGFIDAIDPLDLGNLAEL